MKAKLFQTGGRGAFGKYRLKLTTELLPLSSPSTGEQSSTLRAAIDPGPNAGNLDWPYHVEIDASGKLNWTDDINILLVRKIDVDAHGCLLPLGEEQQNARIIHLIQPPSRELSEN